ncbi:sulfotransferase (plasmid) [Azospirillum oryzae]|uniref:Sulfotransferase n=1 Tax=Azospirillum oryzae TaxID=286727 RepID=A0A6N1AD43_9PROT|nr:sulfotransferase [Azospirillum oryzae]KAA0585820.1 sulfotransferase [Azospirillum oryzae]QKS49436.1 sulfotransferase [Azospirillum oryzae]
MTPWLRRNGHRIFHPLAGADAATLATVLRDGGGVGLLHLHRVATALGAAAIRAPLDLLEQRRVKRLARQGRTAGPPPLFILGHWRSGTTHLLNLLAQDPRFAAPDPLAVGLPWGFLGLSSFWRSRLEEWLPPDRIIDAMPVDPTSPQEDELALALMQPLSYYHGIFFPKHLRRAFRRGVLFEDCRPEAVDLWRRRMALYLTKMQINYGGRRLLIKNPAHTPKLAELLALRPDAVFVHIHRDPYEVFSSTRRMLLTLLREFSLQSYDPRAVDGLVLDLYPAMMARFDRDRALLPPGRLVEIRYDRFVADPLETLGEVYDGLALGPFEPVRPRVERYLADVRDYRRARHDLEDPARSAVRRRWAFAFDRWGY